jgi:hypothetical protein
MKIAILFLFVGSSLWGQRVTGTMTANIRGGSGDGKCTIEANVDDVAEVEVRGRTATIRTLSGAPASLRRFDCNQEMPRNPTGFRFKGVDGRGRQELVQSPSDRGRILVRLEDSKGGSEGYTFDLTWTGSGSGSGYDRGGRGGYGGRGGWDNGWGSGSGWTNNGSVNFNSGRRGSGEYRDRSGQRRRIDSARVMISDSGLLEVFFESDQGRLSFSGNVDRRDGRRVFAPVRGSGAANGARGTMEVEMSSQDQVRSISLPDIDLRWSN